LGTADIDTMQAQTSIRVPDTSMTPPLACLLSAASIHRSISTGKERDAESGNDYFDARYYSSAVGRFMSPDWSAKEEPVPYAKMDDPQSLNLYAYVRNNPLTRVDADGHDGCCEITWNDVQTGFEVAGAAVTAAEAGVVALGAAAFGAAAYSAAQGNSPYLTNGYPTSFNLNPTSSNAAPAPQPAGEQSTPASPGPDGPYKRPNNATTQEQRDSVQGKPCATCGATGQKNNADHKEPLVEQHYKGGVDKSKMHSTDAVQPQCASCSNQQGGFLSGFSKAMKKLFGF
jgi:RHS repeat-associated protein